MRKKMAWNPPDIPAYRIIIELVVSIFLFVLILCSVQANNALERYVMMDGVSATLMDVIGGAFAGFWLHAAVCAALAIRNYKSFYTNSRSIYLMKRTGSRSEIHFMSLSLPVIGLIAGFILAVLMMLGCRGRCIEMDNFGDMQNCILDIWRALI